MYTYTFINGNAETIVDAVNLITACEKLNIKPTRIDKLSKFYLQSTPFNNRVHTIWVSNELYKVKQFNKILT